MKNAVCEVIGMNEPKRHHYIPQFILKTFSFDGKGHVHYYSKFNGKTSCEEIRNTFMALHLYRDEINSPDFPTVLEHDLARFESDVAQIINQKFLRSNQITLSMEEDSKLRLFFAIMGLRSERTRNFFASSMPHSSRSLYANYQHDGDLVTLWKRNLSYAVSCRSIDEILNHPQIDAPFKAFLKRDSDYICGLYFSVAERKDCEEFLLSDCYPIVFTGVLPNGLPLQMYSVFPISPDRVIFMMSNGVEGAPPKELGFRPLVAAIPRMNGNGTYTIRVKKLYAEEVKPINDAIYKNAAYGVIFKTARAEFENA